MVAVGDIIEISEAKSKEKAFPRVSLLGRRYEVKEINPSSTGSFPALKATPLNYEYTDKKGKFFPTSPLYNPQADGSTWESSGLSHKGRTRSIKPNTYFVVQSPSSASPSTSDSDSSPAPVFGMVGATQEDSPKEEVKEEVKDDLPAVDLSGKSSSVEEQIELVARLFNNIEVRSNKHFQPYSNDRELDYEKFSNYRIRLDEDNAKGMSVRVIFSSPIEERVSELNKMNETDFFKMLTNSRTGIVRQYTIGEPVQDVVNRSGNILPLQYFKNDEKWNKGGKVVGITIDFAPVIPEVSSTPESDSEDVAEDVSEGFEGMGSLFGAENMDGLNTYPRLTINLVGDGGVEFSLMHTYQGDIQVSFPEEEKEEVVEVTSPATFIFGGQAVADIEIGSSDSEKPEISLNWDDIVMIPNYDPAYNRFPTTNKDRDANRDYDIRAVVGIDFNHDHPVFRPYEKPYVVDWDNAPSILGSSATGYIEAIFTVSAPNLPEGSVTDRLLGYYGESNPPYNPEWMEYPRKVSVILPAADSEFMSVPSDDGSGELQNCGEVKYYEHKGKYRDIQLIQVREEEKMNTETFTMETIQSVLTSTWKVGEDYEFETKKIGASGYQKFKGELTGLIVRPNESREPAFNSATQSRRERRLQATNEKDMADIFFNKDENNPNTFVVVLKNEKDTPYSGQIIRVKLGGDK